jgi:hypothetical protein
MLGQINEWFFHDLAGIQSDPLGPGFAKIIIKPAFPGDLTFVKAAYNSVHGRITSQWNRDGQHLTLNITIPANTTATVFVPASHDDRGVFESGRPVIGVPGIKYLRMEAGAAVYEVGSGAYQFASEVPYEPPPVLP